MRGEGPKCSTAMPQPALLVRLYNPAIDLAAVVQMCENSCKCVAGRAATAAVGGGGGRCRRRRCRMPAGRHAESRPSKSSRLRNRPAGWLCAVGGTDPLLDDLAAQAAEPSTRVWVARRAGSAAAEAVICGQIWGDALWVWGARTLAAARGHGLGSLMLVRGSKRPRLPQRTPAVRPACPPEPSWQTSQASPLTGTLEVCILQGHVVAQARLQHTDLRWALAATTQAHQPMIRLSRRVGWSALCELDIWPR